MKQRLMKFFAAVLVLLFYTSFLLPFSVIAGEIEEDPIELTNEEYENYINDLLRPTFFEEIFNDITASAKVDLGKFDSSNVPASSGVGSAGSASGLKDFGMEILKDLVLNITNKAFVDGSTRMPDFNQRIGKLRNVYNSGLTEIITCGLTIYQTERTGNLGDSVGTFDDHCILTLTRQTGNYYTITTICDTDSEKYCDPLATANFKMGSYSPYVVVSPYRFYDDASQSSISGQHIPSTGTYTRIVFNEFSNNDLEEMPGFSTTAFSSNLYFVSHDRQGVSEFSSGSQYRTLAYILRSSSMRMGNGNLGIGICFSVSNTITNDYQEYSQQQEINNNADQKQSITYLSELNTTNVINENNIQNYRNMTYNFDSWWQSNVTEVINNNITNVYNNYWITPTDPPETIPPVTQPPTNPPEIIPPITQPVTDPPETIPPAIQPPTDPPETIPPVTQSPTDPPEAIPPDTYLPPIPSESLLPEYTLDVSAISAGIADIKKQAFTIDFSGSFWLLEVMNYLLTETGLLPLFIFAFFMSLLGYFLWK